ncbi:hypothetical protein M9434_004950 [Picochlorum sp. BPE23]|nr:hypothetical protein M9434_004950 [Picochlorum sp. BPE23]KAI8101096.1 hypothetical protein M9435_001204 [Picochlorum sp. BPE23]
MDWGVQAPKNRYSACRAILTVLALIPFSVAQENLIDSMTGRALTAKGNERVMTENGQNVPSWLGRLDSVYGMSYFTPSYVKNSCAQRRQQCSLIAGQSYPYEQYPIDPTDPDSSQPVMKISYPAGSWSPGSEKPGGVLFYTYPTKTEPSEKTYPVSASGATLEYEVYFPLDFEWVKGGKLPGFMGGASNGIGCGGGNRDYDCFSYRVMWRREGYGEAYVYAPFPSQDPTLCPELPDCNTKTPSVLCNNCDGTAGWSLGRASFRFQPGQWNKVKVQMKLNNPGYPDGMIRLVVNDQTAYEKFNFVWRTNDTVKIEGINIASWYGGSDATWSPNRDQYIYIKNYRMYYDGPNEPLARSKTKEGPQVVISMEIDEAV